MQSGHCIDAVFVAEFQNFILRLLLSMHCFRVLKSKISKFYPQIHDLRILCRDFRFYRGGEGLRGRISCGRRLRSTALLCLLANHT